MGKCKRCGTALEDYFDYCPECGIRLNKKIEIISEERRRPDSSIYEYDEAEMNRYGICNKKFFFKGVYIGIIIILISFVMLVFTGSGFSFLLNIIALVFIFTSNSNGKYRLFIKQCDRVEKGMSIHQVRAMFAFIKPYNEGFNRHNEYIIVYNTNTKRKKGANYEEIAISFDENAEVIDIGRSYKRTS